MEARCASEDAVQAQATATGALAAQRRLQAGFNVGSEFSEMKKYIQVGGCQNPHPFRMAVVFLKELLKLKRLTDRYAYFILVKGL